jgi:hypothetical protein
VLAQSLQSSGPVGTHPAWHFAIVAAAGVGVFAAIKAKEAWDHRLATKAARARSAAGQPQRTSRPRPTGPIVALAVGSAGCSIIHAAVCRQHFREWVFYGLFFLAASAAQAGWAVLLLLRPSRRLLTIGAVGNAAIVVLWGVTRTIGLPVGPQVWRPEAVGTADALAAQLEIGVTLGAAWLLLRGQRVLLPLTRARLTGAGS